MHYTAGAITYATSVYKRLTVCPAFHPAVVPVRHFAHIAREEKQSYTAKQ